MGSKQQPTKTPGSNGSLFVVGEGHVPPKRRVWKGLTGLGAAVLGVVVIIVVVVIIYGVHHKQPKKADNSTSSGPKVTQMLSGPPPKLGTQDSLDAQLAKATTPEDKRDLYLKKVDVGLLNNEPLTQVIGYATQAESLAASDQTALTLGQLYQRSGDKAQAAKYYQLYLSRGGAALQKSNPEDYNYYTQLIQQLEAGQ